MSDKAIEIQLMKQINNEYEERFIKLKNRIQRLKSEEEDYRKKIIYLKRREEQDKQIKDEKEKFKKELKKNKYEQDKALKNKKNNIKLKRENDIKIRNYKKNVNLSQKKKDYKNILTDKYLMKVIKEQLNTQQKNKNAYSHAKIKQEYNEYETNRMKRIIERENFQKKQHEKNIKELKDLEKEMRNTCNKLEIIEKEYLDKLNKTKMTTLKIMESNSSFNLRNKIDRNRSRLHINKSMEDLNLKGVVNDEDRGGINNRNNSLIINRKKQLNLTSKSQSNHIISNKQKTKKKGLYININYYPQTNREMKMQKNILNKYSFVNNKVKENLQVNKKMSNSKK